MTAEERHAAQLRVIEAQRKAADAERDLWVTIAREIDGGLSEVAAAQALAISRTTLRSRLAKLPLRQHKLV